MFYLNEDTCSAFNPERLREARLSRGLSLEELGKSIGVSRQAVSQYEHGIYMPTPQVFTKLIDELGFDVNFFAMPQLYTQSNVIHFRKLKRANDRAQGKIKARISWIGHIVTYMSEYLGFPELGCKLLDKEEYSDEDIEALALSLREEWGLGLAPIGNMTALLENKGIFIAKVMLGEEDLDACSTIHRFADGVHPLVCLSFDKAAVRSRFDLAHELGHIVMHSGLSEDYLTDKDDYNRVESEANRFAGAFLMPLASFAREVYSKSSIHAYITLKKRWRVSIGAMIRRLSDSELLSENQYEYLQRQISMNKWRKKEPLDDELSHERPVMLKNCVKALLDNGIKSAEEILDEIPFPLSELLSLCGMNNDEDNPFRKEPPQIQLRVIQGGMA